jgi:hypothetical protein
MSNLTSQILERFSGSGTVERAALSIDANYDSIGRVLTQLVRDRRLVRVGRGRYRKANSKTSPSASSISELIERRVRRSKRNVFLRRDFEQFGSYDAVGRALRQQTEKGRLLQVGYGLYTKAEWSSLTGKLAPVVGIKRLATEALKRLGKTVDISTLEISYNSGASTQVPTGRVIAVKNRVRRCIGYDGNYVILESAG